MNREQQRKLIAAIDALEAETRGIEVRLTSIRRQLQVEWNIVAFSDEPDIKPAPVVAPR